MSTFVKGRLCYMCHGAGIHHMNCPEMMDETGRDKMFPGRKRAITEPIPPTTPSKSTHTRVCAHLSVSGEEDCYNYARVDKNGAFCLECAKNEGLI